MNSFRYIPLQTLLKSILISTFAILIAAIIYLSSYEYSKSIDIFSKKLITLTAKSVILNLQKAMAPSEQLINITKILFDNHMIHPDQMIDYTYFIAKNLPHYLNEIQARITAWGGAQGNSVQTIREPDGTFSTIIIKPDSIPPVSIKLYRNQEGKIIKQEQFKTNFDPRLQPWYIAAQNSKQTKQPIWTDIFISYPFNNSSVAGVIPIYDTQKTLQGVFEIEVKILGLTNFL